MMNASEIFMDHTLLQNKQEAQSNTHYCTLFEPEGMSEFTDTWGQSFYSR